MKKHYLILATVFVGILLFLAGCGSDGGSDDYSNSDSDSLSSSSSSSSLDNSTFYPLTTANKCTGTSLDNSFSFSISTEGDIVVDCQEINGIGFYEYKLKEGVDALVITQIIMDIVYDIDSSEGAIIGTEKVNLKEGRVEYQGRDRGENINCVEIYVSPLPTTLITTEEISDILEWEGDIDNLISTSCPDSWYDDVGLEDDEDVTSTGTINTNYTLTDNEGKIHLITEEMRVNITN